MALPDIQSVVRELPLPMRAAMAPLRKPSFGLAVGAACALGLALMTVVLVVEDGPNRGTYLGRLTHFFPGYSVTYQGAALGLVYGFAVGFVGGVFAAWLRDVMIRIHVFLLVIRERARASRNVLDDLS